MTNVAIYGFIGWLGLAVVAWLVGAFVAARQGRWGWFALALCLPYAGSLLYSVLESIAPPPVRLSRTHSSPTSLLDELFERRSAASEYPAAQERRRVYHDTVGPHPLAAGAGPLHSRLPRLFRRSHRPWREVCTL